MFNHLFVFSPSSLVILNDGVLFLTFCSLISTFWLNGSIKLYSLLSWSQILLYGLAYHISDQLSSRYWPFIWHCFVVISFQNFRLLCTYWISGFCFQSEEWKWINKTSTFILKTPERYLTSCLLCKCGWEWKT